jgi:hypothetical protein
VLFNEGNAPQTIKALLDQSPQVTDGEFELKGARYPIMRSQPIPHPFKWDDPGIMVELYSVCVTDFGSGKHFFFFHIDQWLTDGILQHNFSIENLRQEPSVHMPYALQKSSLGLPTMSKLTSGRSAAWYVRTLTFLSI